MAANKFATMLQRNTNTMTLVLVYALLEWVLIALLLINSLFSYLIVKFADYFGLQPPCVWCSRLDHVFQPRNGHDSLRDLICEAHAKEISALEYCSTHRRLAESRDLCDHCSPEIEDWSSMSSKSLAFFPWMNQIGIVEKEDEENEKERVKCCSCCGVSLSNRKLYHPCIVIKPSSWGVLDYSQKKVLDDDDRVDCDRGYDHDHDFDHDDRARSDEELRIEENSGTACRVEAFEEEEKEAKIEENGIGVPHLEFYIGEEDCTLIPIVDERKEDVIFDFDMDVEETKHAETWLSLEETLELVVAEEDEAKFESFVQKPVLVSQGTQTVSDENDGDDDNEEETHLDAIGVHQQGCDDDEIDGEISIGTEIPDHELIDEDIENEQVLTLFPSEQQEQEQENIFTSSINLHIHHNHELELFLLQTSPREVYNQIEELSETSDVEGEFSTVEKLKSALSAVYAELEEERSASAVAASHTMAMINRLQEEKAAVQMEAVQYHRMMEEQSEYDQEALHLLNELVEERDRVNQELQKQLDTYRYKDVLGVGQNTPVEAVLDQLRVLEERIFTLTGDDERVCDDQTQHFDRDTRVLGVKGRRLLPLFDAVEAKAEAEESDCDVDHEFIRHCMTSLKKGDEGLCMLGEILQHLRRLRTVERDLVL